MLQGHVDGVSRRLVEGWAADDAKPDEALDVSIFIDGRKVAQLHCDLPREDLLQTGLYGNGDHGFAFMFAKPLPEGVDVRLSVRFSATGSSLTGGERIVAVDGVRVLPPPAPLLEDEPVMMPGPRDPRALLELLFWYDQQLGLSPMLARLDLGEHLPQHIQYAAFGNLLDDIATTMPGDARYYPHDHLSELLLSDAFQSNLLPILLRAFDEKRRLIFIHIPKCAGTDLSNKLKTRYPWVDFNMMDCDWTSKDAMLGHLSRLVVQMRFNDHIYICGHPSPNYYALNHLIRPTDQAFTIVRHPSEVVMSQVNYVLTRFQFDIERGAMGPDTRHWLELIGMDSMPEAMSEAFVNDAGMRALRNSDIVRPNSVCYWLGGDDADAQTALESLISQDIEVTDTDHYNEWLAQRWNIRSQTRDNSSTKFFTTDMLTRENQDYIREMSIEDAKLYRAISGSIASIGRPSVTGHDLARGLE